MKGNKIERSDRVKSSQYTMNHANVVDFGAQFTVVAIILSDISLGPLARSWGPIGRWNTPGTAWSLL